MIYLICLVDIVNYSNDGRTHKNWSVLQSSLADCLKLACAAAGIPWDDLKTKDTGDGMQIVAPQSIEGGLFAGPFLEALLVELDKHNETHEEMEQIQLRVAFDLGEITQDEDRLVGPALIHTKRLIDAEPLKKALEFTSGTLGVIASQFFHRDVIKQSAEYQHREYREIYFETKEASGKAWIRVLGKVLPPPEPRYRKLIGAWNAVRAAVRGNR